MYGIATLKFKVFYLCNLSFGVAFRHKAHKCGNLSLGGVTANEWPQERKHNDK